MCSKGMRGYNKMNEVTNLITNVGFPIACCVVLFYNNSKFTEALNNLNVTLKEISTRIENLEDKMEVK